jgi:hypothetical protein
MSAPSRRPEIRRRRTRSEKISLLRKRYATAKTDAEKKVILERVRKVSIGMNEETFLQTAALQTAAK